MGMNLAVKTFYREILLSILAVLLGFFLVLVTMDGLEEMKNLGEHDYTWRTLISVVLLRSPDYVYRLLPICTLIGGVLALSNMAARSELIAWRASGLSVRHMVGIIMSMGAVLAVVVILVGEAGIANADQWARSIKNKALHSDSYFKNAGGFWSRQILDQNASRMINVRTVVNGDTLQDVRLYELTPDFALKSVTYAKTAQETEKPGQWLLKEVHQYDLSLSENGVVAGKSEQKLDEQTINLGDNTLSTIRYQGQSFVGLPLMQLSQRIDSLQSTGQRSRDFELGFWQKLFYPLSMLTMLLLALPFAFMQTRKGGVGVRVVTGIFLGLLFFILSALVQFLGPLLTYSPALIAVTPTVLFLIIAMIWLWRVTRVV